MFLHIFKVQARYLLVGGARTRFGSEARHIRGTVQKVCNRKEMSAMKPCHTRAAKIKHRWVFSGGEYFYGGELRSWTVENQRSKPCIYRLQKNTPQCDYSIHHGTTYGTCPACERTFKYNSRYILYLLPNISLGIYCIYFRTHLQVYIVFTPEHISWYILYLLPNISPGIYCSYSRTYLQLYLLPNMSPSIYCIYSRTYLQVSGP